MNEIKPAASGQGISGIMSEMSSDYKILCKSGKDLLGEAKLFCGTLSKWIELDWWRKWYNEDKEQWYKYDSFKAFVETGGREGLGLWLEREGKDLQMLVKAGIEGAERIWLMWMELEHEEGRGLQEHGGQTPLEDGGDNVTSSQRGNSKDYTMARFIRDIHSEETPPERKQQLQTLLTDVKGGAKSVHRAAVAAGYRRRSVSVPSDDANRAMATLLKHYSREQLIQAIGSSDIAVACHSWQKRKSGAENQTVEE